MLGVQRRGNESARPADMFSTGAGRASWRKELARPGYHAFGRQGCSNS